MQIETYIPAAPDTLLIRDCGTSIDKMAILAWAVTQWTSDDPYPLKPVTRLGVLTSLSGHVVLFPDGHVEGNATCYWPSLEAL